MYFPDVLRKVDAYPRSYSAFEKGMILNKFVTDNVNFYQLTNLSLVIAATEGNKKTHKNIDKTRLLFFNKSASQASSGPQIRHFRQKKNVNAQNAIRLFCIA
jgi:hypothetical protein